MWHHTSLNFVHTIKHSLCEGPLSCRLPGHYSSPHRALFLQHSTWLCRDLHHSLYMFCEELLLPSLSPFSICTLACYTKGDQRGSSGCVQGFPSIFLPKWPSLDCSLDEWSDKDTRGHNLSCSVWKPSSVSDFFLWQKDVWGRGYALRALLCHMITIIVAWVVLSCIDHVVAI